MRSESTRASGNAVFAPRLDVELAEAEAGQQKEAFDGGEKKSASKKLGLAHGAFVPALHLWQSAPWNIDGQYSLIFAPPATPACEHNYVAVTMQVHDESESGVFQPASNEPQETYGAMRAVRLHDGLCIAVF